MIYWIGAAKEREREEDVWGDRERAREQEGGRV